MKRYILILFASMGLLSFSQNGIKPTFEAQGDLIQATYFHENGSIQQQWCFTKQVVLEGLWTSVDFQCNKLSKGYYSDGLKTGQWLFWTENVLKEVDFLDSKIINVSEWRQKSDVALNIQ